MNFIKRKVLDGVRRPLATVDFDEIRIPLAILDCDNDVISMNTISLNCIKRVACEGNGCTLTGRGVRIFGHSVVIDDTLGLGEFEILRKVGY